HQRCVDKKASTTGVSGTGRLTGRSATRAERLPQIDVQIAGAMTSSVIRVADRRRLCFSWEEDQLPVVRADCRHTDDAQVRVRVPVAEMKALLTTGLFYDDHSCKLFQ
ncbi:hypothetical protein BaRGS_00005975, partial [Batillaria attramentaria]